MTNAALAADRGEDGLWTAVLAGDRDAFAVLADRYQRELEVHCYRGSIEDAEDAIQEIPLRARTFLANYALAPGATRHVHVPTRANRQPDLVERFAVAAPT